jgi:hypothetical protein
MRGRPVPLSVSQRLAVDLLHFEARVPTVVAVRRMNLAAINAARARCASHPRWLAIFTKAFGMLAQEVPELRRVYLPFPWPHLYEYPTSVAMIFIGNAEGGDLLTYTIRDPASLPVIEIDKRISRCVELPRSEIGEFRRLMLLARLPAAMRRALMWLGYNIGRRRANYFGTFAVTTPASCYVAPRLSAWTTRLNYAGLASDGTTEVSCALDHRVVDGPTGAQLLPRLEALLNGAVAEELRG